MPKVDIIQPSFAAGEFAPSLYGRTDIAQYSNACQLVENFLPRPYGSLISTPGTRYVATVSDSSLRVHLIKFIFNRTDAYVIEVGDVYMRFFTNRGQVLNTSGSEDYSSFGANLIAQYKFNDNTNSTVVIDSASTHTGTSSSITSTLHATGKVGTGSFNFGGLYSVEIPDSNAFSFSDKTTGTNSFSLVAWVYVTITGTIQDIITKWDTPSTPQEYVFQLTAIGNLKLLLFDIDTSSVSQIITTVPLTEGWHLVAATYNGVGGSSSSAGMNLYSDGAILSNVTRSTDAAYVGMTNGNAPLMIGALRGGGVPIRWFADKIDNVAIFNKNLSAAEVLSLLASTVYQITSPFLESEVSDIQYTQLNDVIWITHPNHPPQRLIRTNAASWAISDFAFKGGPFLDQNTNTAITITPSATTGTINITVSPTNSSLFTVSMGTLGHKNSYWMIGGLAQTNSTTGLQEMGYVQITSVVNSYTATATVIKNLKSTSGTSTWAEGAWSAVRGYPARVTFHERRLWFARTDYEPQKVWGSKVFEYDNYTLDTESDDDGLNLPLASNESNEIQWQSSGKSLIAGTFGGAFIINSKSTDPITPDNANASEEVGFGSASIPPKKIGNFLYFVQRFAKKLREMFYAYDTDSYKAVDRTILSPHILGDGVIDMDAAQNPDTVLYCVLTSGTLATMTREVDQDMTAWARQTTNGTYTSVAVIPSQAASYDEAWVVVTRYINGARKKYVEYFENIEVPSRQDQCLYLHAALSYSAYDSTTTSACSISLSQSSGSITLTSSTGYFNGGQIGKRIRAINSAGTTVGEGQITATTSTTSITLSITTTFNALSYAAGFWGVSVSTLSGLSHLEAKTVGILADGRPESLTRTIASAAVTLGTNYFVVTVGLSYDQILYTLPKEAGSQRGTSQGKLQRFNEVAFKVNRSLQDFYYGPDSSNLDLVSKCMTPSVTSLYTGVIGNLQFRGGYKYGAQIYLKNSNPLPLELLNIIGTLETFDK